MTQGTRPENRLAFIDALRGLAASSVMVFHFVGFLTLAAVPLSTVDSWVVAVSRYGWLGVQVFFVLSGYVIAMTAPADRNDTLRFLARRVRGSFPLIGHRSCRSYARPRVGAAPAARSRGESRLCPARV